MDSQLTTELKERYGIVFHDISLLEQAFTHPSYVNKHRYSKLSDNEHLEFLGGAVLELVVSRCLYLKFPELPKGKLMKIHAAIVRGDSLAKFTKECHFDDYILLGRGEETSSGRARASLLYDLFETFLGVLYLDQKVGAAKKFIESVVFPKIDTDAFSHEINHKIRLQEVLRHEGDVSIEYRLIREEGPAHDHTFFIEVYMSGGLIKLGQGKSKRLTEQNIARRALESIPQ